MRLPIYQVDAFAARVFAGNPAAVCPLADWLPDQAMQSIAAENNLSETAFLVGGNGDYTIRWFTPTVKVELCGHATLASGHVVMRHLEPGRSSVRFRTLHAGELTVERDGELYVLDFPTWPPKPVIMPPAIEHAFGARPEQVLAASDYLCIFRDARVVRSLKPDLTALRRLDRCVIVSAPGPDTDGEACDFVSRYFAPCIGIDEDAVTGAAHCVLAPYWAQRLGKTRMVARQVSARGGELHLELKGGRVRIGGRVAPYLEGTIDV